MQIEVPYEYYPSSLWVGFYQRLHVDSYPRSSSSNTGAKASMARYYSMAAGYNWGVMLSCVWHLGGWSNPGHFRRSTMVPNTERDDSRSVRKCRLVKQSTQVAASLALRHHGLHHAAVYLALWYGTP